MGSFVYLFPQINVRDGAAVRQKGKRGTHDNRQRKFTDAQILEIRRLQYKGYGAPKIASELDLDYRSVWRVTEGITCSKRLVVM